MKKHKNNRQIELACQSCNKLFWVSPYRRNSAKYCSRVCTYKEHGKKVSGAKSHLWKGGISSIGNSARMTTEYKQWRISVYQRDGYKCQMCGKIGKDLNANHIKKWSDYPELRFELTNGITLCKGCHKRVTWHEKDYEQYFYSILGV